MTQPKATESLMQICLTRRHQLFDFTSYSVVPNVSHGLHCSTNGNEADLVCLSKSCVFHEVEIKCSIADLRADVKKVLAHSGCCVKYLWFALPLDLELQGVPLVPERAGIVICDLQHNHTRVVRKPKLSPFFQRKPSDAEVIQFLRLGVIRMWSRRT